MILVFGGTTEGRIAIESLDAAGTPFFYSTKSALQEVVSQHAQRITGAKRAEEIVAFCQKHQIGLIVDAAHPFAELLHRNIAQAAEVLGIPVIRLERQYPPRDPNLIWCETYDQAVERLQRDAITKLLALTGVQTISKLKAYWIHQPDTYFRVLDREESIALATRQGFPKEKLCFYQGPQGEQQLLAQVSPQAIITKESGTSGGFIEKVEAAQAQGIPVYVVARPPMPKSFITATGKYSLRRLVEKLLPSFFPLHSGVTTGSCATAATKAALTYLLTQETNNLQPITLPNGEEISIPIKSVEPLSDRSAKAVVIKESGDDPDVTNGHAVEATVELTDAHHEIRFLPGKGVGIVTLPGLGLPIGQPAINKVPRAMMEREVRTLYPYGVNLTIAVPDGEELASKTFNPRLGVAGGISIIGTSGIVLPFSVEGYVNSIRKEIEVARAVYPKRLVINSGAKSVHYLRRLYPDFPLQSFVHYGNFIGETLTIAHEVGFPAVSMGIMIGKAVKLAEGHLDTHSKKVEMNKQFLYDLAESQGASLETLVYIKNITMARELWHLPHALDLRRLVTEITKLCYSYCKPLLPRTAFSLFLIDEEGQVAHCELE